MRWKTGLPEATSVPGRGAQRAGKDAASWGLVGRCIWNTQGTTDA